MMGEGWINLAHQLRSGMSAAGPAGKVEFTPVIRPIDGDREMRVTRMNLAVHVGTHMDAACHYIRGGRSIDEYGLSRFAGTGIAVDVRREGAVAVTARELADAVGGALRPGDILLLCFGYGRRFGAEAYRTHPYLTVEAATWIVERGVKFVGVDLLGPDLPEPLRPNGFTWPVHRELLGSDVLIVENISAALEPLCGSRVDVIAHPVQIVGADGGLCVPLARVTGPADAA